MKDKFASHALSVGSVLTDVWTRNWLRVDYDLLRKETLTDENIWTMLDGPETPSDDIDNVRNQLSLFIDNYELTQVAEPLQHTLSRLANAAGVPILEPVIRDAETSDANEEILKSTWLMEVNSKAGKAALKKVFSSYRGSNLARLVVANHLFWRVFWVHHKTDSRSHFLDVARSSLGQMGLRRPMNSLPKSKIKMRGH